ncbi:conserved hypothetical protein [Stutzerimonas stutzeri A1501]|uniref:DUF2628 domain-containing protein n=1 Tax=Stutzerimonas stutzeri (strain A1501) TaxID=379731 RepID=A4VGH9_STUS1|nr:DUF2628 domain-containing protein [Stutzerimonas stutzeri]ABP78080.1 conserved hypothetical protein [Stutzerimonas stutzeri A1501]UWG60943.1 DUF2628 domain-containing protein [Stutzerimonas stutzeri]
MDTHNPYAPPLAVLAGDETARIEALPVSASWKRRFLAIAQAGGPRLPLFKRLPPAERRKALAFNILAFLFGPLYYLAKGMWRRAISYTLLALIAVTLIVLLLDASGYGEFARLLAYGVAGVFAMRANLDFYKRQVLGDNGWL